MFRGKERSHQNRVPSSICLLPLESVKEKWLKKAPFEDSQIVQESK